MIPFCVRSLVRSILRFGDFTAASILLPAILSVSIVGCRPSAQPDKGRASAGPISVSPNPVPAGPGPGTTNITWTGDGSVREVYCSINGGEEQRNWGQPGKTGSFEANYINAGAVYEFRLYRGTDHKELLGSVSVTRENQ